MTYDRELIEKCKLALDRMIVHSDGPEQIIQVILETADSHRATAAGKGDEELVEVVAKAIHNGCRPINEWDLYSTHTKEKYRRYATDAIAELRRIGWGPWSSTERHQLNSDTVTIPKAEYQQLRANYSAGINSENAVVVPKQDFERMKIARDYIESKIRTESLSDGWKPGPDGAAIRTIYNASIDRTRDLYEAYTQSRETTPANAEPKEVL